MIKGIRMEVPPPFVNLQASRGAKRRSTAWQEEPGGGWRCAGVLGEFSESESFHLAYIFGETAAGGEESREYQVRIEQNRPGTWGAKRRKNDLMDLPTWSSAWNFTCSCGPSYYSGLRYRDYTSGMPTQSPICKHIGAALIVHFH